MAINLKSIWDWFMSFFKKAGEYLQEPAAVAVRIVNIVKDYIKNPAVDFITMLTKTDIDNRVVELVRLYLPKVLRGMLLAERIITDVATGNISDLLLILGNYLKGLGEGNRGKWYGDLAALILQITLPGREISYHVSRTATSVAFYKSSPDAQVA